MDKQNITLSIRKDLLTKIKILAARQNTSISSLMASHFEVIVTKDEGFQRAKRNQMRNLQEGFDLGTNGVPNWLRDELHDR